MIPTPQQEQLRQFNRPLIPILAAQVILDTPADKILAMIEDGRLAWAWDIRSAGAERREVRIWRTCIAEIVNRIEGPRYSQQLTEDQVLSAIVPFMELRSTDLQRVLSAGQQHVQALIDEGSIQGLNESHRGPYGYVCVARDSVVAFLKGRRVI